MYTNGDSEMNGSAARSMMFFILGAAVGATCALLYAPASGEEIRGQIADKAHQFKDKAVELKDKAVEKAETWKSKAAEVTADTMDRTAQSIRKSAQAAQSDEFSVGIHA